MAKGGGGGGTGGRTGGGDLRSERDALLKEAGNLSKAYSAKYANVNIESSMSKQEKALKSLIAQKYSQANTLTRQIRASKA